MTGIYGSVFSLKTIYTTTLLKEYSDISATYNEISQVDYISKLIEQQRKQDVPKTRLRR